MRRTELLRRIGSYATMLVVAMLAMLSTGCGSDEEDVPVGEYYIGPDKDGWCTYTDKEMQDRVYAGFVIDASEEYVTIDTYSPDNYGHLICVNITKKIVT